MFFMCLNTYTTVILCVSFLYKYIWAEKQEILFSLKQKYEVHTWEEEKNCIKTNNRNRLQQQKQQQNPQQAVNLLVVVEYYGCEQHDSFMFHYRTL